MFRHTKSILGYSLLASDGEIGKCKDFLFDDQDWAVRYLVAKTEKWLPGRKVVISPVLLNQPDWVSESLPVRLTKKEIKESPALEEHAPVSRQYEINYHLHFAMPFYWMGDELWGAYPDPYGIVHPVPEQPAPEVATEPTEEAHLRSVSEVIGYRIGATNGDIGHVEDFLVDDTNWALRYLLIDTRNWMPGRKVLLSTQWVEGVQWADEHVHVDLDKNVIKNTPEYDTVKPIDREYEKAIHDHYERPYYWNYLGKQ